MRLLLPVIILSLFFITPVGASVTDVIISPEEPMVGDTLVITIYASPNEEVPVYINFDRDVSPNADGFYILQMSKVSIPTTPNNFEVTARRVKDLTVALKIAGWVTVDTDAIGGTATISQGGIPTGKYDTKIFGYAENGVTSVNLDITAETTLKANSEGIITYRYSTSSVPAGYFTAIVGGTYTSLLLAPKDTTAPIVYDIQPTGSVETNKPTIYATYNDTSSIDISSIELLFDGTDVTLSASITESSISYTPSALDNNTQHTVTLQVADIRGNTRTKSWSFTIQVPPPPDTTPPQITSYQPTGLVTTSSTTILASFFDDKEIDVSSIQIKYNGIDMTDEAQITENTLQCLVQNLDNNTQYTILLTISDKAGNEKSKEWTFNTRFPSENQPTTPKENTPPHPKINGVTQSLAFQKNEFDATESYDDDGIIIEYRWNMGDGTQKTGIRINHIYTTSGEYTIQLTIRDNNGQTATTTHKITIIGLDEYTPEADAGTSRQGFVGYPLTFSGAKSQSIGGIIQEYTWDFGDGSKAEGKYVSHIYLESGTYQVTLQIRDALGATDEDLLTVLITEVPETANKTLFQQLTTGIINIYTQDNLQIKINTSGPSNLLLLTFNENPKPDSPLPKNTHGNIIDVSISNPDTITWPIHLEIAVNITEDFEYLGMFYYTNGTWHQCTDTGINQTSSTVWANIQQNELTGSPLVIAQRLNPATFKVDDFKVTPNTIKEGENIVTSFSLTNRGDLPGAYNYSIMMNDTLLINDEQYLEPGEAQNLQYVFKVNTPGSHLVSLDNNSFRITVDPKEPNLVILIVNTPDELYLDESYNISVTVKNNGDALSTETYIDLLLDNSVIYQTTINPIEPRMNQTVTLLLRATSIESEFMISIDGYPDSQYTLQLVFIEKTNNPYLLWGIAISVVAIIAFVLIKEPTFIKRFNKK